MAEYPTRPWLVNSIIPEESFTLIGGRSGAAKSTLIFQGLEEWITKGTFLKYPCTRIPHFHYIAFDRIIKVIHHHLNILKIDFKDTEGDEWVKIYSEAMEDYSTKQYSLPPVRSGDVVIFDGLDMLTASGSVKEFRHVNSLCKQCLGLINDHGISIIGLIGAVKSNNMGKDEGSPWDKLLGSGVWQRVSETNMLMEPLNAKDIEDPNRILYIRPRFSKPLRMFFAFQDDSRLYPAPNPESAKTPEGFFHVLPEGIFTTQQALKVADTYGVRQRVVYDFINYLVDEKKWVIKLSHGKFRKNRKYQN